MHEVNDNIGAHMSISGGVHKAIERGKSVRHQVVQIFTKNNMQWQAKEFASAELDAFQKAKDDSGIHSVIAHNSYLINLAALKEDTYEKSMLAFADEMKRCHQLKIKYLVFHPGSHGGAGEENGLNKIAESLNRLLDKHNKWEVHPTFETTAGQGKNLGYSFEHFNYLLDKIEQKERIAFCVDTCHIFAAGYDISTEEGYKKTFDAFDSSIGLDKIAVFHVNDSKKELGSRVDRHEHLGKGTIGVDAFRLLMKDERFKDVPKILETPKGDDLKEDIINTNLLRSF
ncbi:MAG: deoxyribonuclease IV [Nitrospinae bacterium]|nr:deoxyribonuclease IV [Nitrospinota bacterium]